MTRFPPILAFLKERSGAVAIEFAAIALPLFLVLVGSIEVSRYIWTRLALQDAASVGSRCVGLRLDPCFLGESIDPAGTSAFVKAQAQQWGIKIPDDTVTPLESALCHNVDDFSRITIRHRFTSVLAVLPEMWIEVEACFPAMPSE